MAIAAQVRRPREAGRDDQFRSVRHGVARQQAQGRIKRSARVVANQIAAVLGLRIGHTSGNAEVAGRNDRGFQLDAFRTHTPADIGRSTGTRGCDRITIAAIQAGCAAVDVLHQEDRTVEGVQLEAAEVRTEQRCAQAERTGRVLRTQFIAVHQFRLERQVGNQVLRTAKAGESTNRRLQRRTVEVETARLVAARVAGIGHQVVGRTVGQDGSAGPFVFATAGVDRNAIQFRGRVTLTGEADQATSERTRRGDLRCCASGRRGHIIADQSLDSGADCVVVPEVRTQILLVVGVTNTQRQIELVRDVEDVVREQRPVLPVLTVFVTGRTEVVQAIKRSCCGYDVRTRSTHRTSQRSRADGRCQAQRAGRRIKRSQASA